MHGADQFLDDGSDQLPELQQLGALFRCDSDTLGRPRTEGLVLHRGVLFLPGQFVAVTTGHQHEQRLREQSHQQHVCLLLEKNETAAAETAICILDRHSRKDDKAVSLPKKLVSAALLHDGAFDDSATSMFSYHWGKVARAHIDQFPDEAKIIFSVVTAHFKDWRIALRANDHYTEVLLHIVADGPEGCWKIVSDNFADLASELASGVSQWLKSRRSFSERGRKDSPISVFPE